MLAIRPVQPLIVPFRLVEIVSKGHWTNTDQLSKLLRAEQTLLCYLPLIITQHFLVPHHYELWLRNAVGLMTIPPETHIMQ